MANVVTQISSNYDRLTIVSLSSTFRASSSLLDTIQVSISIKVIWIRIFYIDQLIINLNNK